VARSSTLQRGGGLTHVRNLGTSTGALDELVRALSTAVEIAVPAPGPSDPTVRPPWKVGTRERQVAIPTPCLMRRPFVGVTSQLRSADAPRMEHRSCKKPSSGKWLAR
jgi:hypothetical protein